MYSSACQRVQRFTRLPTLALPAMAPIFSLMKCGNSADTASLARLRAGLRGQVQASPLCNTERFASDLLAVLREAWTARGQRGATAA